MIEDTRRVIPFSKRRVRGGDEAEVKFVSQAVEALDTFWRLLAQGMDRDEAEKLLADGLRAALPPREGADDFPACARCDDSGFTPTALWVRIYQESVRYVRYCDCSKGQRMRARYESDRVAKELGLGAPKPDLATLAKTKR